MAIVSIAYTVPVQVWVDMETNKITRVTVVDESIERDEDGYFEVMGEPQPSSERLTAALKAAAYETADGDGMWPGWTFGF